MRTHRAATAAAFALVGAAIMPSTAQAAVTSSTFYVDNAASASCSDSTTDSSATPYCTIQAAVDTATSPGDTVIVSQGVYAPFTVTSSGTAAAPITIEATANVYASVSDLAGTSTVAGTLPENETAVSLNGASYVNLDNLYIADSADQPVLSITDSSNITVNSSEILDRYAAAIGTAAAVSIVGQSSAVTLSRDYVRGISTGGAILADGGSGDMITTDEVVGSDNGPGVVLDQVADAGLTSNTLEGSCGDGIDVADGSTSATIENNVVEYLSYGQDRCSATAQASGAALVVDGASTTGTTADYNTLATDSPDTPDVYSWAGTGYTGTAAFTAATGQGAHDSTQTTNSANSDAPGELATDMYGNPRVDDPEIATTGAGTYGYYDRGAVQSEDPVGFTPAAQWASKVPVGATGTYPASMTDRWGSTVTGCTYDFGDGTASVTVAPTAADTCSAQHAYAAIGEYRVFVTVTLSDGYDFVDRANSVEVVTASAFIPAMTATTYGSLSVMVNAYSSTDDWSLADCSFDFGDGSAPVVGDDCSLNYTYKTPGTRTITVTITDAGGNQQTVSQSYTTGGSFYTPITPARVLDTRHAIGVSTVTPVAADGFVRLKITGLDGLPATGVTAVALNLTATDATKIGYLTAYPDGGTLPDVSNVDFTANQNVANTVVVAVGSDGYVDLANESAGTTDIVADLEGYYAPSGTSGYTSVDQVRLLDTRKTKVPVAPGGTVKLSLSAYPDVSAAVLNLTVTDATGNGYIVAYPDGGTEPGTSNLNYLAGRIVANEVIAAVGSDGEIDFTNPGKAQVDLIIDLSGYFTPGSGDAFTPVAPERYLDTRDGLGGSYPSPDGKGVNVPIGGNCPAENGHCMGAVEVPAAAAAVVANVTETEPTAGGYLTAYPGSENTAPITSLLNFTAGQQNQNALTVGLGSPWYGFYLDNDSAGGTQLIVDVFGYYGG